MNEPESAQRLRAALPEPDVERDWTSRYYVEQQGFWWWVVKCGSGDRTLLKSGSKAGAERLAKELLCAFLDGDFVAREAIQAAKQAEPVATELPVGILFVEEPKGERMQQRRYDPIRMLPPGEYKLYATAQQAEPLSDEQITEIWRLQEGFFPDPIVFARSVIAADRAQAPQALAVSVEPQAMGAEGQWLPIESAPKDGTRFMAVCGTGQTRLVRWADYGGDRYPIGDSPGVIWDDRPTHWMPIPAAPNRSQDTAA